MSQEIINVLNYLGEKLGIAIDWTSANVMPQVTNILGRYRIMEIVSSSMALILCLAAIIVMIAVITKNIKAHTLMMKTKEDNFWWVKGYSTNWMTGMGGSIMMIAIMCGVFGIGFFFIVSQNLLEWIFVPEIQYLELLKGFIAQ